jgi:hypothetical protein
VRPDGRVVYIPSVRSFRFNRGCRTMSCRHSYFERRVRGCKVYPIAC